jgi:hypothetical protein
MLSLITAQGTPRKYKSNFDDATEEEQWRTEGGFWGFKPPPNKIPGYATEEEVSHQYYNTVY